MTSSSVAGRVSSSTHVLAPALAFLLAAGCSSGGGLPEGSGGGTPGSGGNAGTVGSGGARGSGGAMSSGGATGSGGNPGNGGATKGGNPDSGGIAIGKGGSSGGGVSGKGGVTGAGGKAGASGAATDGGAVTSTLDCTAIPAMPTGGTKHTGDGQGGTGNLAWQLWANTASNGSITTFTTPAFSAAWNNAGDYLARLGFEWGNSPKTYDAYGTITADFAYTKTGTGGSFSYIGIYGWSTNPCVEWYIVDDSFGTMPFNPYNSSQKGTATIDGETYKLFSNSTNGTGGSRCNASSWTQHWSVRQKARQCGTISITQHFDAWKAAGMTLGTLLEAKILVEAGGGSGSIDFPVANLAKTQ
jgi:endo-1,4-beta-xylanase